MKSAAAFRLPRKWSILALGITSAAAIVLFYLFTISIAAGAIATALHICTPFANNPGMYVRLLLAALSFAAGVAILRAMISRHQDSKPRGALIDLVQEPRLAAVILAVSSALSERMPSEVYLVAEANASVGELYSAARKKRRRVLVIGLPLMQILTVSQFGAVLAHEFAHFYGGDTKILPWVYNAKLAMIRVYDRLAKGSAFLRGPMVLPTSFVVIIYFYKAFMFSLRLCWKTFLYVTQLLSRQQEYRSDEIACRLAGPDALIGGLQAIHKCQAVSASYWQSIVCPLAAQGYQPQIADGFMRFINSPNVAKKSSEHLEKVSNNRKGDVTDSHPPLSKRILRAKAYSISGSTIELAEGEQDAPAISLLDNIDKLEIELLEALMPMNQGVQRRPVRWANIGEDVYLPMWRQQTAQILPLLYGTVISDLPDLVRGKNSIANRIVDPPGVLRSAWNRHEAAAPLLSAALALSLHTHGWVVVADPGQSPSLRFQGKSIDPNFVVSRFASGTLTNQQWTDVCTNTQIGSLPLA